MEWQVEWRRLALMHTLRPLAAAGCVVAALLPFGVAAWRQGIAPLVGLWPLLGLALALIAAGVLGWQVGKANGLEALAWMVVASFVAGIAGLAVSRGLVF